MLQSMRLQRVRYDLATEQKLVINTHVTPQSPFSLLLKLNTLENLSLPLTPSPLHLEGLQ